MVGRESATLPITVFFCILLLSVALVGTSTPGLLKESTSISALNAWGGGVLLSAALLHLFHEANSCEALKDFPWSPAMLASGYLFLLTLELVVDRYVDDEAMERLWCCPRGIGPASPLARTPLNGGQGSQEWEEHLAVVPACAQKPSRSSSPIAAVAATVGLSFHSIFEGIALGLRTGWGDFVITSSIITLHKFFAAFALGALMGEVEGAQTLKAVGRGVFSLATPCGMIFGMLASMSASCVVTAPLNAFSAGSLMWVALHEVIGPITRKTTSLMLILAATWSGFLAMSVLALWI